MLKRLPAMWETRVRSLGQKDPLEKEMETHSSTLAWKIPWTEESCRLQSMGSQRVRHDWVTSLLYFFNRCVVIHHVLKIITYSIVFNSFKLIEKMNFSYASYRYLCTNNIRVSFSSFQMTNSLNSLTTIRHKILPLQISKNFLLA